MRSSRAVEGVDLRPLACSDCGFEPHRGHECRECCVLRGKMSLRRTDHSSRGTLTDCGIYECDCEAWIREGHGPTMGRNATEKKSVK